MKNTAVIVLPQALSDRLYFFSGRDKAVMNATAIVAITHWLKNNYDDSEHDPSRTDEEISEALVKDFERFFELPEGYLTEDSRKGDRPIYRYMVIHMLIMKHGFTGEKAAQVFGKTHCMAIHASKTLSDLFDTDPKWRNRIITAQTIFDAPFFGKKILT